MGGTAREYDPVAELCRHPEAEVRGRFLFGLSRRLAPGGSDPGEFETSWVFRCPVEEGEAAFMDLLRSDTSKIKVVLRY